MISSNKLSLFPNEKSNGLSDVPVEVSKRNNNCGCSTTSLPSSAARKLSPKPNAGLPKPIHQTAQVYGYQCRNSDGSFYSGGTVVADDEITAWGLVGLVQLNINNLGNDEGVGVTCDLMYN